MGSPHATAGLLTAAYTDAEAESAGIKGKVITVEDATGKKVYKCVQNSDTSNAIPASNIVQITDMSANKVAAHNTLHEKLFGGVRPVGADDIQANVAGNKIWGYVQILGYASMLFGDTAQAILAGDLIVPDDDADLGRVGGALTAPASNSAANIGLYGDCHDSAFAVAKANSGGVADEVVLGSIFRSMWGQMGE